MHTHICDNNKDAMKLKGSREDMRQVTEGEGGEGNAANIVQCIKLSKIIIF